MNLYTRSASLISTFLLSMMVDVASSSKHNSVESRSKLAPPPAVVYIYVAHTHTRSNPGVCARAGPIT